MRWLVVLALVSAHVARADDAADRDEARREFAAGQAADRQRDWPGAIEHYLRANDLVPHPNAMFNIANDYERLGKLREAAQWYQRYIDTAQDSPDRDKVIRILRDLLARPGTITVRTQNPPADVRVIVDGGFVGVTPYSGHIKGGAHRVTLEFEGRREEREVKIEFGEPATLDVTLRDAPRRLATPAKADPASRDGAPPSRDAAPPIRDAGPVAGRPVGTLRVTGNPPGARVLVDNRPIGPLPLDVRTKPGLHAVRVVQPGFQPYDTTVEVRADEVTAIEPQLARTLGTVDQATTIRVGYLAGAGGGLDANGNGGVFLVEGGVRSGQSDVSARVGKVLGFTTVDLLIRYALTKTRVAPFIAGGYTFVGGKDSASGASSSTTGGYLLTGGLRIDLSRGEHTGISLIGEVGVRRYADLALSDPSTGNDNGLIVPVMTSLQISYK